MVINHPKKRWKVVVFSAARTQGVGLLGDGQRQNGGKWGKVVKSFSPIFCPNFSLGGVGVHQG